MAEPAIAPEPSDLPARDAEILAFERLWWRHAGAKEDAIRDQFGLSVARYYQLLNAVIDTPEALRSDPILVGRLLRARDARVSARSARRFRSGAGGSFDCRRQENVCAFGSSVVRSHETIPRRARSGIFYPSRFVRAPAKSQAE